MMMVAVTDATRCLTRPRVSPRAASRNAAMPAAAVFVRARSSVKHASTRRATAVRATSDDVTTSSEDEAKRRYVNFTGFPFPLVPFLSRRTVLREVVKNKVWTLEQEQGIGFDLGRQHQRAVHDRQDEGRAALGPRPGGADDSSASR
jgi:hypothetical protein